MDIPRTFVYGAKTFPECAEDVQPDAPAWDWLENAGVRICVVPDAGHMMVIENPTGFIAAMKQAGVPVA